MITEPALTNVGVVLPDDGFLAGVRAATRAHGTLLVLDETHTQTVAYGGLTRAWGLEPDVVTLGKSLGGGMPVGAYGITAELRDQLEAYRDAFGRVTGIATGGTTYANPLSLAAVVATLTHVQTPKAFERTARSARSSPTASRRRPRASGCRGARTGSAAAPGYCLEPELPRNAREAARSIDVELVDARRLHLANRGIWDAIASAGPGGLVRPHGGGRGRVSCARSSAFLDDVLA